MINHPAGWGYQPSWLFSGPHAERHYEPGTSALRCRRGMGMGSTRCWFWIQIDMTWHEFQLKKIIQSVYLKQNWNLLTSFSIYVDQLGLEVLQEDFLRNYGSQRPLSPTGYCTNNDLDRKLQLKGRTYFFLLIFLLDNMKYLYIIILSKIATDLA